MCDDHQTRAIVADQNNGSNGNNSGSDKLVEKYTKDIYRHSWIIIFNTTFFYLFLILCLVSLQVFSTTLSTHQDFIFSSPANILWETAAYGTIWTEDLIDILTAVAFGATGLITFFNSKFFRHNSSHATTTALAVKKAFSALLSMLQLFIPLTILAENLIYIHQHILCSSDLAMTSKVFICILVFLFGFCIIFILVSVAEIFKHILQLGDTPHQCDYRSIQTTHAAVTHALRVNFYAKNNPTKSAANQYSKLYFTVKTIIDHLFSSESQDDPLMDRYRSRKITDYTATTIKYLGIGLIASGICTLLAWTLIVLLERFTSPSERITVTHDHFPILIFLSITSITTLETAITSVILLNSRFKKLMNSRPKLTFPGIWIVLFISLSIAEIMISFISVIADQPGYLKTLYAFVQGGTYLFIWQLIAHNVQENHEKYVVKRLLEAKKHELSTEMNHYQPTS